MQPMNLYDTLGVGRQDCSVSVRRAYRDLARLSHATTDAVPQFVREMEIAVAILSDGARRMHYDDVVRDAGGEASAGADPDVRDTQLDLLTDFDGGPPSREEVRDLFRCNFAPGAEPKSGAVRVLELRIRTGPELEPDSPESPAALSLAVPIFHACASCHGTGSVDWLGCGACGASGLVEQRSVVRIRFAAGERLILLGVLGVRTPVLRLRVGALA